MSAKDLTILIVDDEPDLRDVLGHQLRAVAGTIETAPNGAVALEMIGKRWYDAVLSDISMPDLDGLQLLAKIREAGHETPFVILTGFGDKSKAVTALRLGAFDFLDKPWSAEQLRKTVSDAAQYGRQLRGMEEEVERITSQFDGISQEQREQARSAQRALLKMRASMSRAKKAG